MLRWDIHSSCCPMISLSCSKNLFSLRTQNTECLHAHSVWRLAAQGMCRKIASKPRGLPLQSCYSLLEAKAFLEDTQILVRRGRTAEGLCGCF